MTPTFNLLDEPWIRVTTLEGETDVVSLTTLVRKLPELAGIHGEIASQDLAVLRLLLAIVRRATGGPERMEDWERYWRDTSSFQADLVAYLEQHRSRFDLRSPTEPFFQVAGIHSKSGKVSGLESLIIDVPNGTPFFTTRMGAGLNRISWAEAARWLVHVHAFDPSGIRSGAVGDPAVKGGKGYPIGPGWAGQIGSIVIEGRNLAETILLNTVVTEVVPNLSGVDLERDLAPWEREPDGAAGSPTRRPTGPVSCYTWQTRRVLLHGDEEGVTGLFLGNGDKATPQNRFSVEPMTAWRFSEPQTRKFKVNVFMPRKLPVDRGLWRGLSTLVAQLSPPAALKGHGATSQYLAPAVLNFYISLIDEGLVPETGLIPVRAIGLEYGSNEAVVAELVDDVLELPVALFAPENLRLVAVVRDAMEESANAASALRNLAGNLIRAQGGDPDRVSAARDQAGADFYVVLDEEFPRWLVSLDTGPEMARERWRERLRLVAYQQAEAMSAAVPQTAFAGRIGANGRIDVGLALVWFYRALNNAVPGHGADIDPKLSAPDQNNNGK